ncbi:MAG: class II aldolase/adducin family protein [Erysipelotrichaceae bacterium]|nr:class II aldolase/adducin family protein [Erysipelotrichaceae bacterium]
MKDYEYRRAIVDVCHMLNDAGFVGTYEGNVSYKNGDKIFITPTQTSKALISEGQIIAIDPQGKVLEGDLKPTSETPMHTRCYELRPDINAVVHCHSPFATAYAQIGEPIVSKCSTEFIMFFGEVPCLKYGTPGTLDIIADLDKYIYDYDVVLLANHGILAVGKDPMEAYSRIMSVEMVLKTEFIRRSVFGDRNCDLPEEEVKKLYENGKKNRGYHGR